MNNCLMRFTVFARCARELGEEDEASSPRRFRAVAHRGFWVSEQVPRGACPGDGGCCPLSLHPAVP